MLLTNKVLANVTFSYALQFKLANRYASSAECSFGKLLQQFLKVKPFAYSVNQKAMEILTYNTFGKSAVRHKSL